MNAKRKGTHAEHRARRILEADGFRVYRSGGSLGEFDLLAFNSVSARLIQVKCGTKYLSGVEREQIALLKFMPGVTKECWRFPPRARRPLIEVL
jgi:Holliday junction resolvase